MLQAIFYNKMSKEKTISLQIPEGKKAEWVNGVLTLVDERTAVDITERIKDFGDAIEILGMANPLVEEYRYLFRKKGRPATDIKAYLALRIITAALNEGWEPKFTKDEVRYFPFYKIYTAEETRSMTEERKEELGLFFGDAYSGLGCGLAAAASNRAWSVSGSGFGSRLAYKSENLALYSAKQFPELWYQFLIGDDQE